MINFAALHLNFARRPGHVSATQQYPRFYRRVMDPTLFWGLVALNLWNIRQHKHRLSTSHCLYADVSGRRSGFLHRAPFLSRPSDSRSVAAHGQVRDSLLTAELLQAIWSCMMAVTTADGGEAEQSCQRSFSLIFDLTPRSQGCPKLCLSTNP